MSAKRNFYAAPRALGDGGDVLRVIACVAALLFGSTVAASASNAWTNRNPKVAGTMKDRGNFRLEIGCSHDGRIVLEYVVRPRRPFGAFQLRIDETVFEAEPEGVGEYGLLLHEKGAGGRPSSDWSPSLMKLLLSGERITLDGPAVARIPAPARTLSLATGRVALRSVASACGQ